MADGCLNADYEMAPNEQKEGVNIALSKNKFAQNILDEIVPFKEVSFQSFLPIFNIIGEIIKDTEK